MQRFKKGSKIIRKIFEDNNSLENGLANLRIVNTFYELTNTANQSTNTLKRCLGIWSKSFFENSIREFLFKLRNNQLGLNNRINAFDNNHDPRCNFCRIRDSNTVIRDSFKHVFYFCPTTNLLLTRLVNLLEPAPAMDTNQFFNMYWYGCFDDNPNWEFTTNIVFDIFRFLIYKFKLRKKIPNSEQFFTEYKFILEITARKNLSLKVALLANNLIANILPALG